MKPITFIDIEIEPNRGKILDIGGVKGNGNSFHSGSLADFIKFLDGSQYICGHNIFKHDLKYIQNDLNAAGLNHLHYIDTLYLSPLLFPAKPYHALLKDDKLQTEETNNPLNDSKKARDLFFDEVTAFQKTDENLKRIFYGLLKDQKEFCSFFYFLGYKENDLKIEHLIHEKFYGLICEQADISKLASDHPVELAYCLALINTKSRYSITPPWVLRNFPAVDTIMFLLRNNPCLKGCPYCDEALDIHKGLKRFFGFDSYRTFAGEPLQEKAVKAAVANKSLLAVFPTGGGKSITFQVPALMSGINSKGLTVVISPLQSLMKDQVDNLEKAGITDAVTINGLLDPIERAKSFERVENGSASILYISPESLRSRTIERLLLGRNLVRFVIDEAHCFSAWGQDFRVDYLYIGDFIKSIQEKKNMEDGIPVSCFTATAKQKVIEDIREYFRDKLSLEMEVFSSSAGRSNLSYLVFVKESEEEKYNTVRDLIDEKDCPTIIYVSRTRKAYELAQRLTKDGYQARPYHGKMEKQEKTENQDAFIKGDVQIMVATSAFGMGVDKKDVGMVIHYEISDSLENYIQEAGRAGREGSTCPLAPR
jgi:ATP-dependent DNA helicase RecQ